MTATNKFSPVELIILQGNSFCNLNCTYCDLSVQSRRTSSIMKLSLVERFFAQLFKSGKLAAEVTVVWHSGEPLTLPPSYYDEAIGLVCGLREELVGNAVSVKFKIQTNGVLINDDWCALFARHAGVLDVGVSCDGPAELHDAYRVNWNGRATHAKAVRGMDLLQKHGIKYKIIAVATKKTLSHPEAFFQFFFDRRKFLSGFHFNILSEAASTDRALSYSVGDRISYYNFYRRLLALSHDAAEAGAEFKILNFSQAFARITAARAFDAPTYLEQTSAPLKSLSLDARGNVTTFYAGLGIEVLRDLYGDGRGLSIGNIIETSFEDMIRSDKLQRMMSDFATSTRSCKESCEYFAMCSGGYEVTKRLTLGTFDASETTECVIHVKTLVDALLDDICEHLDQNPLPLHAAE
jgi:uncharacterized protein